MSPASWIRFYGPNLGLTRQAIQEFGFLARGTRKAEGCGGRRSRPAQRAEAKRTPQQPGRGRRDGP
jgi:hypothetical protein